MKKEIDLRDPNVDFRFFDMISVFPQKPVNKSLVHTYFSIARPSFRDNRNWQIEISADLHVVQQDARTCVHELFDLLSENFPDVSGFAGSYIHDLSGDAYAFASQTNKLPPDDHPLLEEFEWYHRLEDPIGITLDDGRFRSVYRWNLLNKPQHDWLKLAYSRLQWEIHGELIALENGHYAWIVKESDREVAFEVLKNSKATHYRFFHSTEGLM